MTSDDQRLSALIALTKEASATEDELYQQATSLVGVPPLSALVQMSLDSPNDRLLLVTSMMLQRASRLGDGSHAAVTRLTLQMMPAALTASDPRVLEFVGATLSTLAAATWLDGLNAQEYPQVGAVLIACLSRQIPEAAFFVASVIWTGRASQLLSARDRARIRQLLAEVQDKPDDDLIFPVGLDEFVRRPEGGAGTPIGASRASPHSEPSTSNHGYEIEPLPPSALAGLDLDGHLRIQEPWIMRATMTDGRVIDPLVVELQGADNNPELTEVLIDEVLESSSTLITALIPASHVSRLERSRYETTRELEDEIDAVRLERYPWQWFVAELANGSRVTLARRRHHYQTLPLPEPWSVADIRRILPIPIDADADLRTTASTDVDVCIFCDEDLLMWLRRRRLADWWA